MGIVSHGNCKGAEQPHTVGYPKTSFCSYHWEFQRRWLMNRVMCGAAALASLFVLCIGSPAGAWDRGDVDNFATIPAFTPSGPGAACPTGTKSCTSDIEGVAVAPDGTV